MKKLLAVLLCGLLVLSAAACTTESTPTPAPTSAFTPRVTTPPATKSDTARMIFSKRTGRVLCDTVDGLMLNSYNFLISQTWDILDRDGAVTIVNRYTEKALTDGEGHDRWTLVADDVGWYTVQNADTGRYLLCTEDFAPAFGNRMNGRNDYWYIKSVITYDEPVHADTTWMQGKWGVFAHLIPGSGTIRSIANRHDAAALASQIASAGADIYCVSVGQGTGYWNTYNAAYASLLDFQPEARFAREDVISRIAAEMSAVGVDTMVYAVSGAPVTVANDGDCLYPTSPTRSINMDSALLWYTVLRDWSLTYGKAIRGWWIDGCYSYHGFTNKIACVYTEALRAGNPDAVIAYNEGVYLRPYAVYEDYTCGETDMPLGKGDPADRANWLLPESARFPNGSQWFMLTHFGEWWDRDDVRYTAELWSEFTNAVTEKGGCVLFDAGFDKASYLIGETAMETLRYIGAHRETH
ncbi:MAG: hypothetical protein KIG36_00380 [Eubacteriales bacterium]|nr:hypothetical protein [Eubacteriales bacterium]